MNPRPEGSLEQTVPEKDFLAILQDPCAAFFRLAGTLTSRDTKAALGHWSKRVFFVLHSEADELESFLDDYGARYNRGFVYLTELVASTRGFALAGLSMEHFLRRFEGYGVLEALPEDDRGLARADLDRAGRFICQSLQGLLSEARREGLELGLAIPADHYPRSAFEEAAVRFRLPRDVGAERIEDEEQRIAEVATKYLQACTMLEEAHLESSDSEEDRKQRLTRSCTEELARVYEATVHNLQSTYDTYIKNTDLEEHDPRLARLRGHVSATLHLLEVVTQLIHFVERHESDVRDDLAHRRLESIVHRDAVNEVTLNVLLHWALRFMLMGREIAEELLPTYTNVQALEVELPEGLVLHARPASLVVSIVNRYGTPVEMEIDGQVCNAGSILELMVVVGSNPESRRFVFRGDAHPLGDIALLFQHGLGEEGLSALPDELDYLRGA